MLILFVAKTAVPPGSIRRAVIQAPTPQQAIEHAKTIFPKVDFSVRVLDPLRPDIGIVVQDCEPAADSEKSDLTGRNPSKGLSSMVPNSWFQDAAGGF